MSPLTRRDLVKSGAAAALGVTLAPTTSTTANASVASPSPRPDFAAVLRWEEALQAADARGLAWVEDAKQMYLCVQLAVWQAEEIGEVALLESLRSVLAGAEALHEGRAATFQRWADQAWNLPDLAPLPAEPWALLPAEIGEDG